MSIMTTLNYTSLNPVTEFIFPKPDSRTKDWALIQNPSLLITLTIAYLYFVRVYGPNYMKHRKPYDLKAIITVYNIGQIFACLYLFQGILKAGWLTDYSLGCQPVDRTLNEKPYKMAKLVWWTMVLKLTEFSETVFFVLRKKENQITGLHLYHHVSTLLIGWLCCKYTPGGMTTFPILVNCLVHIPMYMYYLIALHGGKEIQKRLRNVKKFITKLQMIQFIIIITHSLSALRSDCSVPNFVPYIFTPNIFLLLYLFYNFYQKTYNKHK